jgi:hypothetical protein
MLAPGTPYVNSERSFEEHDASLTAATTFEKRRGLNDSRGVKQFTTKSQPDSDRARLPWLAAYPNWRRNDQQT